MVSSTTGEEDQLDRQTQPYNEQASQQPLGAYEIPTDSLPGKFGLAIEAAGDTFQIFITNDIEGVSRAFAGNPGGLELNFSRRESGSIRIDYTSPIPERLILVEGSGKGTVLDPFQFSKYWGKDDPGSIISHIALMNYANLVQRTINAKLSSDIWFTYTPNSNGVTIGLGYISPTPDENLEAQVLESTIKRIKNFLNPTEG